MRRGLGPCDDGPVERTVLIVDDHPGFRSAARALLEADGFDVVGEAADGESGLAAAERLRPGLVVLDIQLPDLDGFAVAERLASAEPPRRSCSSRAATRSAYPSAAGRQPGARVHRQERPVGRRGRRAGRLNDEPAPALASRRPDWRSRSRPSRRPIVPEEPGWPPPTPPSAWPSSASAWSPGSGGRRAGLACSWPRPGSPGSPAASSTPRCSCTGGRWSTCWSAIRGAGCGRAWSGWSSRQRTWMARSIRWPARTR